MTPARGVSRWFMTKTQTTAKQVVRSYWTWQMRGYRAQLARGVGTDRGWMWSGARRAKNKTRRLMAEYFGVGEPVQDAAMVVRVTTRTEPGRISVRLAVPASTLHTELARDRGEVHFSRNTPSGL